MGKSLALVLMAQLLVSCASNPRIDSLSSEQRARYNRIEVMQTTPPHDYKMLGAVKGISCHRNAYQSSTLTSDEATEGAKLHAAKLGADAIINLACQVKQETDWSNNCFSSIVCIGDAIQFK